MNPHGHTYATLARYIDAQWFDINTKLRDGKFNSCDYLDDATFYYMYGPRSSTLSEVEEMERQRNPHSQNQYFLYADKHVHYTIHVRHREKRLFDVEVFFRFSYQTHRGQRTVYRGYASNVWIKGNTPIELWLYREFNCILKENGHQWPVWDNRDSADAPAVLNGESTARRAYGDYCVAYRLES